MSSDSDRPHDGARGAGPDRVEFFIALAAIGLGLFVLVGSFSIDFGAGYDRIGPRFFPYLVSAGLLISGGFLAREVLKRRIPTDEASGSQTRLSGIGTLSLALGLSVLLLDRAGFMYLIGMVGFLMRRVDIPVAPAIIGMILGPMAEQQFRRALAISQGDPSVFLTRPISAALLSLALLAMLAVPLARAYRARTTRA